MNELELLKRKYARLALACGVNVQKGQTVMVNADVQAADFAALICEEAYRMGAGEVVMRYSDERVSRLHYLHQDEQTLCRVHDWQIDSRLDYLKEGACVLHVISETPGMFADCDAAKISAASLAWARASKAVQKYTMDNICAWSIVAVPNAGWADQVFADAGEDGVKKLWQAIFDCVYVDAHHDPLAIWEKRNAMFEQRVNSLNACRFTALHFTSSLGTDLTVGLPQGHLWEGGSEQTQDGVRFNANLPTEEVFTMPHRLKTNGVVHASKPLDYNGQLIEDFHLEFQDGKVCGYDARKGKAALRALIEFDEGSSYLGEVALVPQDSAIARSGLLFYNTLFDENASCHLALGDAYPSCLSGGLAMSEEERKACGANQSMTHVDFMFGTPDLRVTGIGADGQQTLIMENGLFAEAFDFRC